MAKDDYEYIEFKILSYYYSWLKGKIEWNDKALKKMVMSENVDECYFLHVLRSLVVDGYLEGLSFTKVWGGAYILNNDLIDGSITSNGAHYIKENSKMKQAREKAKETGGLILKLMPYIFTE